MTVIALFFFSLESLVGGKSREYLFPQKPPSIVLVCSLGFSFLGFPVDPPGQRTPWNSVPLLSGPSSFLAGNRFWWHSRDLTHKVQRVTSLDLMDQGVCMVCILPTVITYHTHSCGICKKSRIVQIVILGVNILYQMIPFGYMPIQIKPR